MVFKLAFLIISVVSFEICSAQNYCDQSLCKGKKHIACKNNGNFASTCTNPAMVQLTQAQKKLILQIHNNRRNQVAGGQTKLSPACRMATMQWDDELARIAAFNVKQCQMKHDACRNTNTFKNSGQNLAMITFTTGKLQVPQMLHKLVNLWYNEIANVKQTQINSYTRTCGSVIGHFTVMVADKNIRVGCAASTFKAQGNNRQTFLLACNYATTNILSRAIYNVCTTAASGCTSGKNPNFANLCSTSESYSGL